MPLVPYTAKSFPATYGPALLGNRYLDLTWEEVLWAAISVGRAELFHILRYGRFSVFEVVYRAGIIFANLCEDAGGYLRRSAAYDGLDPSEKGAISYFLGLTLAKALTNRLLNVPWLMHLDVYRQQLQPALLGSSRPDLVGMTTAGDWIVIESKGRTNGYSGQALQRAKEQATQLVSVNGQPPVLHVGMLTHFDGGRLGCALCDPERNQHTTLELRLSRDDFLEAYYRPFLSWLSDARRVESPQFPVAYRVADVVDIDLTVGLAETLLLEFPIERMPAFAPESLSFENHYLARDGVLVSVGQLWSISSMRLEPQERRMLRT